MYPSPLKGINSTVLSKSQTWMTAATHSEFSIKSNFCLKDIPTSPGLCFDEEKVHNTSLDDSDLENYRPMSTLPFISKVMEKNCAPSTLVSFK